MGYGKWDMGYGIWEKGYGKRGCVGLVRSLITLKKAKNQLAKKPLDEVCFSSGLRGLHGW